MSTDKNCADPIRAVKVQHSKELLISEYRNETAAEHVIDFLTRQPNLKPIMKHTKSTVLQRVKDLLPNLEKAQKDLDDKEENDYNIEKVEGSDSVIEMDVAILKKSDEDESSQSEDETDSTCSEPEEFEKFCKASNLKSFRNVKSKGTDDIEMSQSQLTRHTKRPKVPLIEELESMNEMTESNKVT